MSIIQGQNAHNIQTLPLKVSVFIVSSLDSMGELELCNKTST